LAIGALVLAGCATGDGKTLRPPTAPPPQPTTAPETPIEFPGDLEVTALPSEARFELFAPWRDRAEIDLRHGCDGPDVSPALAWSGVPDDAAELAVSMVDEDSEGMVHWLVVGIDPSFTSMPEGGIPPGATMLANAFGTAGWDGPCPPEGSTHTYRFMLHALDQQVEGLAEASADEALAVIDQLTFEAALATGLYSR
jgi:Raf kinase inhibitor-like YbhB/YbcL family protein